MSNLTDLRALIESGREDRALRLAAKRGLAMTLVDPHTECGIGEFLGYSEDTCFSDQIPGQLTFMNHRHGEWFLS